MKEWKIKVEQTGHNYKTTTNNNLYSWSLSSLRCLLACCYCCLPFRGKSISKTPKKLNLYSPFLRWRELRSYVCMIIMLERIIGSRKETNEKKSYWCFIFFGSQSTFMWCASLSVLQLFKNNYIIALKCKEKYQLLKTKQFNHRAVYKYNIN